ncbi:MAG TPA: ECF-type sigma factor [Pyrinomonadaceae bacterium]|nr:ECF-type sigma factor [Pyrinomonadaceae bacterium]
MTQQPHEVTLILERLNGGDQSALEQLFPLVYRELRLMARGRLRRERPGHTLQPTDLVHEAFLRLVGQDVEWQNRAHFLAISSKVMRRVLVDHARARRADKRGGAAVRLPLDDALNLSDEKAAGLVALDEALRELEEFDPLGVRLVELHVFNGLSMKETADALEMSERTAYRHWRALRARLGEQVGAEAGA